MTRGREIQWNHLNADAHVNDWIESRIRMLDTIHPYITHCHVAVDVPHRSRRKGRRYSVRIDLAVPGAELVSRNHVGHPRSEQLRPAVAEAFRASERQLDDYARARRDRARHGTRRVARA